MPCRAVRLDWVVHELFCGDLPGKLKCTELRELCERNVSTNDRLYELHELCGWHILGCCRDKLHKLRSRHLPISGGGVELLELPAGDILKVDGGAIVK